MYSKGQHTVATVESIYPFGVFVRLEDGARAYIRRRELTLSGDLDPRSVVTEGQQVEAIIVELARPPSLMELSVRDALPDPWQEFTHQFRQGDVVTATIKSLLPDKVFAQIVPGVNGLIPLEELATWNVERPENLVWAGDQVEAVITHLDMTGKRARLSIRRRLEQLSQVEAIVEYLHQKEQKGAVAQAQPEQESIVSETEKPGAIGLEAPILVVEDHDAVRIPLVKWLSDQACTVHWAETAAEAQSLCQTNDYGLLIVDLGLPDRDGLSLVKELEKAGVSAPVAVMSDPAVIEEHLPELESLGVAAAFTKPLDLDEIHHFLLRLAAGERPGLSEPGAPTGASAAQSSQALDEVMRSSRPLAERLGQGLEQLVRETHAEVGIVFHLDTTSRQVSLVAHSGNITFNEQVVYSLVDSPVKDVIREQRLTWENQVSAERTGRFRKLLALLPFESCIGVPLQAGGQTEHALFLFHREPGAFSRYRLRDTLAMATLFAVALESQILHERVQSLGRIFLSGHLAAGFAHEVFNRVSGLDLGFRNVRSDVERLTQAAPGLSEHPDFRQAVRDLDKAVETATDLKRAVEEFQRLMRTEEEKSVDVNLAVRQAEAQVRPLARRTKVKMHLDLAAGLPLAVGGSIRLQQVFVNLMLNAIQQMDGKPEGQRALTVSTACPNEDGGQWVIVRFSDTGPGIHRQLWNKVFDLGFTTRAGGSGLGLYIARSLVEFVGGQIGVEKSLIPLGTTFVVRLRITGMQSARSKEDD